MATKTIEVEAEGELAQALRSAFTASV